MKPLKVLVPVDFSGHSLDTIESALQLREYADPEFLLLHVLPTGEVETFANLGGEPSEAHERRLAEAGLRLERELERLRGDHPGLVIDGRVLSGVPFKEICRLAEEENFQLIVIGTHGRTGLSHLLIGSTAERVVQHAPCPVLSIKPRVL